MAGAVKPEEYGPRAGFLPLQPAVERGVAVVLGTSPDGQFLVYGNGTNVVVRSIQDPKQSFVYGEHTAAVKVAKFAPTGKYIASGDASGKVRVWAFNHPEHPLKYELPSIGGEVEDIAWDSESKRIMAVGGGANKAKVFSWDTGSNMAEVIPHSKKNITCDFKPSRPFKLVFGGEDFNLSFYSGPPFRYEKGLKEHSNFVNCVRYSPDGSRFISVSSDKKALLYDGTSAEVVGRLDAASGHAGSIYSCAWNADGSKVATAGADKTIRVWDVSPGALSATQTYPLLATFTLGARAEDMQNAVVWPCAPAPPGSGSAAPGGGASGPLVTLSLDGTLNFFDGADAASTGAAPSVRVVGHVAPPVVLDINPANGMLYTGDLAGRVAVWTPSDGACTLYEARMGSGEAPTKRLAAIAVAGGELAAVAWDDKLRIGDAATGEFNTTVTLPGQPKGVAGSTSVPGLWIVATGGAVVVVKGGVVAATLDAPWAPTCVDMSADGTLVAVGGGDKKVHLFSLNGGALSPAGETKEAGAAISVVAVSPDASRIAAGDALREVRLFSAAGEALVSGRWMQHTTRVTGLKWNPAGTLLASVSTDRRLCIWDPEQLAPKKTFDLAHPQPFAGVVWASADAVWTLGTDGVVVRKVLVL